VSVAAHPDFRRDGTELIREVSLTYPEAALGRKLELSTIDGRLTVDIPAGTQPGDVVVVRGKGMPALHGRGRGNLHLVVKLVVPRKLSKRQRKLIEELALEDHS
jgi:molecular chaperone DnaJ